MYPYYKLVLLYIHTCPNIRFLTNARVNCLISVGCDGSMRSWMASHMDSTACCIYIHMTCTWHAHDMHMLWTVLTSSSLLLATRSSFSFMALSLLWVGTLLSNSCVRERSIKHKVHACAHTGTKLQWLATIGTSQSVSWLEGVASFQGWICTGLPLIQPPLESVKYNGLATLDTVPKPHFSGPD